MRAVVVANERATHQKSWGGAFAAGLGRHGVDVEISAQAKPCDLLVLWGVRRRQEIQRQKQAGGDVCILERGYLGDRFKWTSVSFGGGLNGRGEFRGASRDPYRFNHHFGHLMQPWRVRPGYALIIGQVPGDMSLAGKDIDGWYRATALALQEKGLEVFFRNHPVANDRGFAAPDLPGVKLIGGTLADAMAGAEFIETFNSNTAVEAVLSGKPATAADAGSMAWEMTGRLPGQIITPDRAEWAARLAWKQWTLEELTSGECWARVSA